MVVQLSVLLLEKFNNIIMLNSEAKPDRTESECSVFLTIIINIISI